MIHYPEAVDVVECGPRDGLQSFPRWVDTQTKIRMIDRLSEAGFPVIETVSFAHPKFIPNLRDAEEVCRGITKKPGTRYRGLVPNRKGAERALGLGLDVICGLSTASIAYTKKNQNMTPDQAIEQGMEAFAVCDKAGIPFEMALGMAFWCPLDGLIPEERVVDMVTRLYRGGVRSVILAGSMGMEDPRHVGRLFGRLSDSFKDLRLGFHIHDMSGMAPANILAALDAGAMSLEGSICGLGGAVATKAVGNIPTEDIVHMLNESGVRTGVSTEAAFAAAHDIAALLGLPSASNGMLHGSRAQVMQAYGRQAAA